MARKLPTKKKTRRSSGETGAVEAHLVVGLDPAAKSSNLVQLRRARGQVEGIERMVAGDRYCAEIILQIIAARASLQAVAKDLLKRHLESCHKAASSNGGATTDAMYQELVELVTRMSK